jgi:hypothetical protein
VAVFLVVLSCFSAIQNFVCIFNLKHSLCSSVFNKSLAVKKEKKRNRFVDDGANSSLSCQKGTGKALSRRTGMQKKDGGRLFSCVVMQRYVHVVQQCIMSEQDCSTVSVH